MNIPRENRMDRFSILNEYDNRTDDSSSGGSTYLAYDKKQIAKEVLVINKFVGKSRVVGFIQIFRFYHRESTSSFKFCRE